MEVFRARRARAALPHELNPGLVWKFKVDGRVAKRRGDREDEGRHTRQRVIGDFAYADDTGIIGTAEEIPQAEALFTQTIKDCAGKVNTEKTEGLRVETGVRAPTDVAWLGESTTVKHVGCILSERAGHTAETGRLRASASKKLKKCLRLGFGEAAATAFDLTELVEWGSKDSKGAYNVRLCEGESTRRQTHTIKQVANWCLFVASKMPNAQGSMQICLDRGPKTRAKGKGKGKGDSKGRGRGKGKPAGRA